LHAGRYQQAKKLYEGTLKWHVENFGEHHYFTAYTRGMYAIALWRNGDPIGARVQFDQAIQNITSPDALTGDFTEDVFRRKGNTSSKTTSTYSPPQPTKTQKTQRLFFKWPTI
jgi:hypothetical protein